MSSNSDSSSRYIALDIHKHYAMVAAVDREGQVLLKPRKVTNEQLLDWATAHLFAEDMVVIESTSNAWHVYDLLSPLVAEVKVANPIRIKQIAEARTKTDKRDALILARLLAANLIPEVWVPPVHVRELRQLISQRRRLVEMHTVVVNRMHSVSHRHHLGHPKGKRFQEKDMAWRDQLSEMERFQLEMDLETKQYLKGQTDRLTRRLGTMSHQSPWAAQALCLMQIPGFGVITTMTVLAAIGDISRFETPKHLVSYAGLAPGVEQSGTKKRSKPITKEGRKELRWAMVEVAWRAVRADPVWKRRFEELKRRKHPNDAITIIAHQLMIVAWHVLTHPQPYRHYSNERIAYKFLSWSWQLDEDQRRKMTRPQFARYYLMRLGIGDELQRVALNPKHPHRLATVKQIQTLFPDLGS
jgi:transposase